MSVPSMSRNTAFTKVILLVRLGHLNEPRSLTAHVDTLLGGVLAVSPQASALLQGRELRKRGATGDAQNLAANVARLLGGEKDVRWRQLGRLGRASDRGLRGTKLRDLLGGHGGRDQWRPHRPWCYRVDPDALRYQVLGKPLGEGDDGTLGGGVVQEPWFGLVGLNGG